MLSKLNYFIYRHELFLGLIGFILSFVYYLNYPGTLTIISSIPGIIFWLSVFFIADGINKNFKEGSIFPHRKDQIRKLESLSIAAFIMNLISDITGSWLLKLWHYPPIKNPFLYFALLAPLGYIMFGLILFLFYKFFKHKYDYLVKPGRPTTLKDKIYKIIMYLELFFGITGIITAVKYYYNFVNTHKIIWYKVYESIKADVNIGMFIILWLSIFFILEFICFTLKRETLTRDLVRGNFIPLISIIISSFICIILVEFINAPIQIWRFSNWPYQEINLFNIPLIAFLLWPMQYLLLLPIIRILDSKNEDNIW